MLTSGFKYDLADQLTEATVPSVSSVVTDFAYGYDKAGNRTSEQIDNAVAAGTHNNLNQLKTLSASGPIRFAGSLNEAGTVTVNGQAMPMAGDNSFSGDVPLPPGSNTVGIVAKDPLNNTTTNNYTVTIASGTARALTYDLNGNMTDNGNGQTYEWDAVNRLTKITYTDGTRTEFTYDGLDRRIKIIEKNSGGSVTSEKRFVWDGSSIVEERDGSNTLAKRFHAQGQMSGSTKLFYSTDHLGSVREMTDSTGAIGARYDYAPYGLRTRLSGDLDADFGFEGMYCHAVSRLNLTLYRAYDANIGRFISRDPIGEDGGVNLYGFCLNDPVNGIDPFGLSDVNLIKPGDKAYTGAKAIPVGGPSTTVTVHGAASGGFYADSQGKTPVSTGSLITAINNSGHKPGQPIQAFICYGGVGKNLDQLKKVAKQTNSPVIAPTDYVTPSVGATSGAFKGATVGDAANPGSWVQISANGTVTPAPAGLTPPLPPPPKKP